MKRICSCNVYYYFHQISTVNGVNGKITKKDKKDASVLSAIFFPHECFHISFEFILSKKRKKHVDINLS